MKLFKIFIIIITTSTVLLPSINICLPSEHAPLSLRALPLDGHFRFDGVEHASRDFGNMYHFSPSAVLYPRSVRDIATTIKHVWEMGVGLELTVAARGHGHSLEGQAQARGGIVIDMETLSKHEVMEVFYKGEVPYVDVCAGELWINVLHECLKYGLAPKSWTDYLYLTVGGTLSNAGISGQAFRHGPQISNVHRLEVVTGKGEVMNCSEEENPELFHGILGGLGQFGIITRARISLEPAPTMVKWIRVVYSDFSTFTGDQELLISMESTFDYIEGFVIINRTGLLNNWRSSFNPQDPVQADKFISDGRTLFCLELAKYYKYDYEEFDLVNQEIEELLSQLSYISSTLFESELSYVDFLNRVHVSEMKLRSRGLWEVPHPWLNLLVPRSKIHEFADHVFGNVLTRSSNGPILIYPLNKSKWDNRTSAIIPEEDIFYLVAFLSSAVPFSKGTDSLDSILAQNRRILEFCKMAQLEVKQYLPHYTTQGEWREHVGARWQLFVQRKAMYDPLAILAPGHHIFQRGTRFFL